MATEPRSTLARLISEVTPGDLSMAFFTNGGAEANENAIKLARWYTGPPQGHRALSQLPRRDGRRDHAHRRPAPLARRAGHPGRRAHVRPYTYRCPAGHPDPCPVCTGAPHLEEILQYEGAHTVAAVILETVTGTNGIIVPPDGYLQLDPRDVRQARDPAHRRRGDGRVRPHRQVVRRRQLGRRPGHHHDGEGHQLRLRPARRDGDPRADRRLGSRQVLRRRAHVQRASARLRGRGRVDRGVPRGGHRRARRRDGRRLRRGAARPRRQASVDRRRARARLLLGARARQVAGDTRAARAVQRRAARTRRRWRASRRRRSSAGSIS